MVQFSTTSSTYLVRVHGSPCRMLVGLALVAGLLGAGCGDSSSAPCAETTCEFGTCDSVTGECVNESSCRQPDACLPGFECTGDGVCEAETSCASDSECDVGVCEGGACVNPDACSENSDCLPRTYCRKADGEGEGTCAPDPCHDINCPRGVCKPGTDACVSKNSCTSERELRDCVSGQKCLDGECVEKESFCDGLDCERGVCSLQEGACVNADSCQGEGDCLDGYFCNSMNLCQRDLCRRDAVECRSRGVCDRTTGRCENATDCGSSDDCIADHLCVEGTCRLASAACGDARGDGGCRGNQKCVYDSDSLKASCEEPDVCQTTLDCQGEARCDGRNCVQLESCREDRFEPNDSAGAATAFTENTQGTTLTGTVCQGTKDYYAVETTNLVGPATRGELVVELTVPPRDRGLGKVEMELFNEDGESFGTASTGALSADGVARIEKQILLFEHGTYTVEVSAGGDVRQPGVAYELSADVLPEETLTACSNAEPLTANQRASGSTLDSTSRQLGSSCTEPRNDAPEQIYEIEVDEPQQLRFELTPRTEDSNLSMSLRRNCLQRDSELVCTNDPLAGVEETLSEVVGPGTYYLVVESEDRATGGPFQLEVERTFARCAPSGSFCSDETTLQKCAADGSRFRSVDCGGECDRALGRCIPPDGDICATAETISPSGMQTRTVPLEQASDRYRIGGGSCLGVAGSKTGGPEVAYEVEIPSRKSVQFEAAFENDVDGSMYLVGDCGATDRTCKEGVQSSTKSGDRERLQYSNFSQQNDETLFLLVDTESPDGVRQAELRVSYSDVVCEPGTETCRSGAVQACNEFGTRFTGINSCGLSCKNATCQGDDCATAIDITSAANQAGGATFSGVSWGGVSNEFSGRPCSSGGPSRFDTDGSDAFFRVDLQDGETLDATVDGDGFVATWIWDESSCGTASGTCLASDTSSSELTPSYTASGQETVYLVVDHGANQSGQFTVEATVN